MTFLKIEKIIFFGCFLFLPTQLGKHFFTHESEIFSIPVDYLSFVIYFWDLLVLFLFLTFVIRLVISKKYRKLNYFPLNIFLIFALTQSISVINSLNPAAGLFRLEQYFVFGFFGFYISTRSFGELKNILISGLSIGLFFETALSIYQVLAGKTLGLWILGERSFSVNTSGIAKFDWFGKVFLRAYGTFPHPNLLAAYSLLCLGIIFGFTKKAAYIILPAATIVVLSFSRSAFLVFGFELLIFFKDLLLKKYKLLILVLIFFTPLLVIRFLSLLNFDVISLIRRKELTEIALKAFFSDPFFGIGLNSFINFVSSSNLISGSMRFLQPVHNIFLLSLAETGVFGFLGFILFLAVPISICLKKRTTRLGGALLICWTAIFILGSLDHYFLTLPQGQRILFLVWSLSFVLSNEKADS